MQVISGSFGVLAYLIGITAGNIALIYLGAVLVLLFSIIPPLFITEPRHLQSAINPDAEAGVAPASAAQVFSSLRPLAGFLLYAIYQFIQEIMHRSGGGHAVAEGPPNYTVEIAAALLTSVLLVDTFRRKDSEGAGTGAFRKILAAHAFTWLGIQTMFVFMFAWLRQNFPDTDEKQLGQQIGWSFFTLNVVGALLPGLLLEPLARRYTRISIHRACIGSMAAGYVLLLLIGNTPLSIYLVMAVLGIGWASTISLVFAIMSTKAQGERMGLFMGLFNLAVVLPQLTVSLGIGRLVSDAPNKDLIFWIAAASLAISALLWGLIPKGKVG
jgi:hypothetical protein